MLRLVRDEAQGQRPDVFAPVSQALVFAARQQVLNVHLAPQLEEYLVQLVVATRSPSKVAEPLRRLVRWGASPRGTIALDRCSRAVAWLAGRDYVTPDDVHAVASDVLRHRILLSWEAEAEGVTSDAVLQQLVAAVPVP